MFVRRLLKSKDEITAVRSLLEYVNGNYICRNFSGEDDVPLFTFPGCIIEFKKIFE